MSVVRATLERVYEAMEGSDVAETYADRHGVESAAILTNIDDEQCGLIADYLRDRIEGRIVVEIGGGIGLLAFHMAQYAKRVYVIEASPAWSWAFTALLYRDKPKNVSFLFGAADEFTGVIRADVALFCTHSGVPSMKAAARLFSETVIDVYAEVAPEAIARVQAEAGPIFGLTNVRDVTRKQAREIESRTRVSPLESG